MTQLTKCTAIITGASGGIGRACAHRLAAEGARLALVGRSKERLATLLSELNESSTEEHLIIVADLSDSSEVVRMVSEAEAVFGGIDVMFANAGVYIPGDLVDTDPSAIDELISLNVTSVFCAIRAVLPGMIVRGSGDIVVTSSVSGHQAIQWEPVYSASKHAVQAFVHGVRRQVSGKGVRVGSLAPGIVLTELWGEITPEIIENEVAKRAGLRGEDVANALMFMLSQPPNVTIRDLVILPADQDI